MIYDVIALIYGAIGVEGFAGAFFEEDFVVAGSHGLHARVEGKKGTGVESHRSASVACS